MGITGKEDGTKIALYAFAGSCVVLRNEHYLDPSRDNVSKSSEDAESYIDSIDRLKTIGRVGKAKSVNMILLVGTSK